MSEEKPVSSPPPGEPLSATPPGHADTSAPASPPQSAEAVVTAWRAEKKEQQKGAPEGVFNIGPKQRTIRYQLGTGMLLGTIALSLLVIWVDLPVLPRLLLFLPFWFAFVGLFQGAEKVCVFHANKGTCDLGNGPEPVKDSTLAAKLKARASWIYFKAAYSALFWTLLVCCLSRNLFGWGPHE